MFEFDFSSQKKARVVLTNLKSKNLKSKIGMQFQNFTQIPKIEGKEAAELDEAVVFAAWRRAVGDTLCEQAVPFRLHHAKLDSSGR